MAAEEKQHAGDRKQFVLIGYLVVCVAMVVATLILAFTPEELNTTVTAQVVSPPTRTLSPFQLTAQADYATVVPGQPGDGQASSAATATPPGGQS